MDTDYKVSILIVDDSPGDRMAAKLFVSQIFSEMDTSQLHIKMAPDLEQAFLLLSCEHFHIVFLDNELGADRDGNTIWGVNHIKRMRDISPNSRVFMHTSFDDIENIVKALQSGAENFLTKKSDRDSIKYKTQVVKKALDDAKFETDLLVRSIQSSPKHGEYVSHSKTMKRIQEKIKAFSRSNEPILLVGPTGIGKSHTGEMINKISKVTRNDPNRGYTYRDVNNIGKEEMFLSELFGHEKGAFTGATSRRQGVFELAQKGDLFIDEIGDLSLKAQGALLDVISHKKFSRLGSEERLTTNTRLIFATNKDLEAMVEAGTFREDLYSRLSPMVIEIPPLKERKEDIPHICETLCQKLTKENPELRISFYDFPANLKRFFVETEFYDNVRGIRRNLVVLQALFGGKTKANYSGWESYLLKEKKPKKKIQIKQSSVTLDNLIKEIGNKVGDVDWVGLEDTVERIKSEIFNSAFENNKGCEVAELLKISTASASGGKRKYVQGGRK